MRKGEGEGNSSENSFELSKRDPLMKSRPSINVISFILPALKMKQFFSPCQEIDPTPNNERPLFFCETANPQFVSWSITSELSSTRYFRFIFDSVREMEKFICKSSGKSTQEIKSILLPRFFPWQLNLDPSSLFPKSSMK